MDYSASITDADHPVGASPWGNSPASSPQPNRSTFGPLTAGPPASPPQFGSQASSNGFGGHEHDEGGFGISDDEYRRPDTASTTSGAETQAEESASEGRPGRPEGYGHSPTVSPLQAQVPNRLPGSTAHAGHEQPPSRRSTQPMYKLQAKITGLERTGRKDPILRFDVHVSPTLAFLSCREHVLTSTDQSSQVQDDTIPRCETHALRVR